MDMERAGLLALSIVASVILASLAWKMFRAREIYGGRLSVLDGINRNAERCMDMGYGDCFAVRVFAEEPVSREDVSALSPDFSMTSDIPEGEHLLKFTNDGGRVVITVVE